ncbi:hypothetical protein FK481_0075 [Listeria phage LP-010]|uniref:DUF1642 domain protein n=3 Tax=Homburgvirus TaxID=1921125 RepID=A0A6C0QZY2_9CAUD|nr:hypothetical protein FK481_0075 [Listeria phage LP-010]QDK04699.1 hypothetical protein FK482_0077 [Listeria phage LP-013]QHZ59420.1 DUF1642 domain protein [Listeria phage LP-018]
MEFYKGQKVEFISWNKKQVGEVVEVHSESGILSIRDSDGIELGVRINNVVEYKEPELPVVPKCVAGWFEENKKDLDYKIWNYISNFEEQDTTSSFYTFMNDVYLSPIEVLVEMKNGYEIEATPTPYVTTCGEATEVKYVILRDIKTSKEDFKLYVNMVTPVAKSFEYALTPHKECAIIGDKVNMTAIACFLASQNTSHTFDVVPYEEDVL